MSKFHPLTLAAVERETRDAVALTFAVPSELAPAFRFEAGQHVTVRATIDGQDVRRSYSICSTVQDGALRIAVKKSPGGVFSTWAGESLAAGDRLDVMPPLGHFGVATDATRARRYVGFAAGSGITPLLSIVGTTLAAEPESEFTLFYGNRASGTVMFRDELAELKDDLAKVDAVYLCGPDGMMRSVADALRERGYPEPGIRIERFAASIPKHEHKTGKPAAPGHTECEVTVILDGATRTFTLEKGKESILEAGLKAGVELPYSCKGGVCSTCRAKLVAGEADMDVNFALEDYEVARGFVLTCQSYPVTDKVTVDYDQAA